MKNLFTFLFSLFLISPLLGNQAAADFSFTEGAARCVATEGEGVFVCTPAEGTTQITFKAPLGMIDDPYAFQGLAQYYSGHSSLALSDGGDVTYLDKDARFTPQADSTWVGWRGRYTVVMVQGDQAKLTLEGDTLELQWETPAPFTIYAGAPKPVVVEGKKIGFDKIQYSHLWRGLRYICLALDRLMTFLGQVLGGSWGMVIILTALILKLLLLPVAALTRRAQKKVSTYQSLLNPKLQEIKAKYKGEEAHNKIMAEYKHLGISPFFTLKPLLCTLIQLPILIAIFNVLGEFAPLNGAPFLWMTNLAYPDPLFTLPFAIPFLGEGFNLMPFLMTAITVLSALYFRDALAPSSELKKQKRNLLLMAIGFFVLFYPFPAAMVFYWAVANLFQFVIQIALDRDKGVRPEGASSPAPV